MGARNNHWHGRIATPPILRPPPCWCLPIPSCSLPIYQVGIPNITLKSYSSIVYWATTWRKTPWFPNFTKFHVNFFCGPVGFTGFLLKGKWPRILGNVDPIWLICFFFPTVWFNHQPAYFGVGHRLYPPVSRYDSRDDDDLIVNCLSGLRFLQTQIEWDWSRSSKVAPTRVWTWRPLVNWKSAMNIDRFQRRGEVSMGFCADGWRSKLR